MKRPLILISNDDGYSAKGIRELVRMVAPLGDVIVCAPEGPRSGKSRAFTMDDITIRNVTDEFLDSLTLSLSHSFTSVASRLTAFACSGTPVDCVKIACGRLCPRRPDLILAGINHGDNASTNAHYSGTVGIAFEGTIKRIPSIAFSLCDYDLDADFTPMKDIVTTLCTSVLRDGLPPLTFLNVNVPKVADVSELHGVRVCRMASAYWKNEAVDSELFENTNANTSAGTNANADDLIHYQLKGYFCSLEPDAEDTDAWALANDYIAITPSTIDVTSYGVSDAIMKLLS